MYIHTYVVRLCSNKPSVDAIQCNNRVRAIGSQISYRLRTSCAMCPTHGEASQHAARMICMIYIAHIGHQSQAIHIRKWLRCTLIESWLGAHYYIEASFSYFLVHRQSVLSCPAVLFVVVFMCNLFLVVPRCRCCCCCCCCCCC
jgi:hypothetical protein